MGNVYGYARVSTREQNLDRQMDALRERGIDAGSVFTAKARGQRFGHAPIEVPECFPEVLAAYRRREIKRKEAAKRLKVSPSTFISNQMVWLRR